MAISIEEQKELRRLIIQASQARNQVSITCAQLRDKIDFIRRTKTSVREKPMKWIGGSAAVGLAISFLFRPKKKQSEMAMLAAIPRITGLIGVILSLVFKFIKPVAKVYVIKLFKDDAQGDRIRSKR